MFPGQKYTYRSGGPYVHLKNRQVSFRQDTCLSYIFLSQKGIQIATCNIAWYAFHRGCSSVEKSHIRTVLLKLTQKVCRTHIPEIPRSHPNAFGVDKVLCKPSFSLGLEGHSFLYSRHFSHPEEDNIFYEPPSSIRKAHLGRLSELKAVCNLHQNQEQRHTLSKVSRKFQQFSASLSLPATQRLSSWHLYGAQRLGHQPRASMGPVVFRLASRSLFLTQYPRRLALPQSYLLVCIRAHDLSEPNIYIHL